MEGLKSFKLGADFSRICGLNDAKKRRLSYERDHIARFPQVIVEIPASYVDVIGE
jgi:hypothetical protein